MFRVLILLVCVAGCDAPDGQTQTSAGTTGTPAQDDVMKISMERSGGFAGMTRSFEVDVDALPEDQRSVVMALVDDANFFALPASIVSEACLRSA